MTDTFSAGASSFTGQHRCSYEGFKYNETMIGFIVSSCGEIKNLGSEVYGHSRLMCDEAIPVVTLPFITRDKGVFGVICGIEPEGEINVGFGNIKIKNTRINKTDRKLIVNSSGNGYIACCEEKGRIYKGDYIYSY